MYKLIIHLKNNLKPRSPFTADTLWSCIYKMTFCTFCPIHIYYRYDSSSLYFCRSGKSSFPGSSGALNVLTGPCNPFYCPRLTKLWSRFWKTWSNNQASVMNNELEFRIMNLILRITIIYSGVVEIVEGKFDLLNPNIPSHGHGGDNDKIYFQRSSSLPIPAPSLIRLRARLVIEPLHYDQVCRLQFWLVKRKKCKIRLLIWG